MPSVTCGCFRELAFLAKNQVPAYDPDRTLNVGAGLSYIRAYLSEREISLRGHYTMNVARNLSPSSYFHVSISAGS
jgi:hypothetical protein